MIATPTLHGSPSVSPVREILLILSWSFAAGAALMRSRRTRWRPPIVALSVSAVTGAMFLAQLAYPSLLAALQRDSDKVLLHSQWWRLITGLLVQDGWVAGATTNLAALLIIGMLSEQWLSRLGWLAIYLTGALVAEGVGLAWQPIGGGNSVAVCALAGALAALRIPESTAFPATLLRGAALAAALALIALRDIHGVGIVAGAALTLALCTKARAPDARF